MKMARLTSLGIGQFASYIANLRVTPTLDPPLHLLSDLETSEPVDGIEVEQMNFSSRYEAANYLDMKLGDSVSPERDAGLGAWLALFYFDQLCPKRGDGTRLAREDARYIPATGNFQRFYRHLLLGPLMIFRAHKEEPERARAVLTTAVSSPGDIVEQLASRQELITNRAVMAAATALYFDKKAAKLKRGSGGKGGGSPRRLADILNQLDLTFDLYAMSGEGLLGLLPPEFNRFKK